MQQISVVKERSIRRHYESNHSDKFRNLQRKAKTSKARELLSGLKKQKSISNHSMEISDVAVRASYFIAKKNVVVSKPFSDCEFAKKCWLTATYNVCPEKCQSIANISLTRCTISDRFSAHENEIIGLLREKVASFVVFSVAIDQSADITNVGQLEIFIHGVDASLPVTEELVLLVSMTGMTNTENRQHNRNH